MTTRPILLTGATGQIGAALRPLLERLAPVAAPGRRALDLADPGAVRRSVRDIGPALIVNAGAYTAVDRAESEPELAMAVNGAAPGILAEEARRLDIPLVHFSTDYVFDGAQARSYVETDVCAPANAYGRSKLAGERAIAEIGGIHLILRTSWVYSIDGGGFLATIRRLLAEPGEVRVVDDQTGGPTWAASVAHAVARVLGEHWDAAAGGFGAPGGLYHLTAAGRATWCGFARAIAASGGGDDGRIVAIPTADYPTPARRPANSVLDNARFAATFGFSLADWRDQLAGCLAGRCENRFLFARGRS